VENASEDRPGHEAGPFAKDYRASPVGKRLAFDPWAHPLHCGPDRKGRVWVTIKTPRRRRFT
jgi:hypothetical protein